MKSTSWVLACERWTLKAAVPAVSATDGGPVTENVGLAPLSSSVIVTVAAAGLIGSPAGDGDDSVTVNDSVAS